jgi:hypothetical protein
MPERMLLIELLGLSEGKDRTGSYRLRWITMAIALAATLLIGFIEYATGRQVFVSVFFLLPIVCTAWFGGATAGGVVSMAAAALWFMINALIRLKLDMALLLLNAVINCLFYIFAVFMTCFLKRGLEREKKLVRDLRESREKIRVLEGFIPICAWCKRIRTDSGYWIQLESYLREHTEADFTHGICPECAKKAVSGLNGGGDKERQEGSSASSGPEGKGKPGGNLSLED